jgi:multidrug resistance efflux pump
MRHERPAADTMFRLRAPLHVGFPDGKAVRVDDWSLRALYSRELVGKPLDGLMLSIPFQGAGVYFPVRLEPGEAENEFLFCDLTGRQRETLALFYRNLMSGRMAVTGDIITALDTPVDMVPMGETPAERAAGEARVGPRKLRILANVAYYSALFLLVFGFLGMVLWSRVNEVSVLSAHVAAATSQVIAPVTGLVREMPVAAGTKVQAGDILVRLDDQDAQRLLAETEEMLAEAENGLALANRRLLTHMETREEARATFRGGPERFDAGEAVNPGDFNDIRIKLETDIVALVAEVERLSDRLESLRERAVATSLTAPGPGKVLEHFVRPFDMVRPGDPLILFELDEPRSIQAHLPVASVLKVWTGMRADVTYMRDGRAQQALGEVRRIVADGRGEQQLLVLSIVVPGVGVEESRVLFMDGMPVHVVLRPQHIERLLQRWWR